MKLEQAKQIIENANLYTYLGKIDKIVGTTVESTGPSCRIGDVCTIDIPEGESAVYAEVVGFRENKVLLMPYEDIEGIGYGSAVRNTGERLRIPVTRRLIGRTVDAMGVPMDNKGPLGDVSCYPITGRKSNPMDRPPIDSVMQMGVKAIDGLMTIGKGQRMGIFSGSGVGKSTLMGMIAKNVKADVNVIALVGERSREVVEFIRRDLGEEGLKRSVLVVATSNEESQMHHDGHGYCRVLQRPGDGCPADDGLPDQICHGTEGDWFEHRGTACGERLYAFHLFRAAQTAGALRKF